MQGLKEGARGGGGEGAPLLSETSCLFGGLVSKPNIHLFGVPLTNYFVLASFCSLHS